MAGAGVRRDKARELLGDALPRWRPIRVRAQCNPTHPDVADDWTFRIERDATGEVMLDIPFRGIASDTRQTVFTLIKLLDEHALLLGVAVEVARVELGVSAKRLHARKPDPEREQKLARILDEAKKMEAKNPRVSCREIARRIVERGFGDNEVSDIGEEAIRKELSKRTK